MYWFVQQTKILEDGLVDAPCVEQHEQRMIFVGLVFVIYSLVKGPFFILKRTFFNECELNCV